MTTPAIPGRVNAILSALGQPGLDANQARIVKQQLAAILGGEEYIIILFDGDGDEGPEGLRINLPAVAGAIATAVGGYVQGGLLGAVVGLVAVWGLTDTTSELSPTAAVVVELLAQAPENTIRRSDLEVAYANRLAALEVRSTPVGLEAVLQTLAMEEVLGLDGDDVTLEEITL